MFWLWWWQCLVFRLRLHSDVEVGLSASRNRRLAQSHFFHLAANSFQIKYADPRGTRA